MLELRYFVEVSKVHDETVWSEVGSLHKTIGGFIFIWDMIPETFLGLDPQTPVSVGVPWDDHTSFMKAGDLRRGLMSPAITWKKWPFQTIQKPK